MAVMRVISGRLQVVCGALLLLAAVRVAEAARPPARAAAVTAVRAALP